MLKGVSNMAVYPELGRVPLTFTRFYSLVKYWSKVLVSDNCIYRQCYNVSMIYMVTYIRGGFLEKVATEKINVYL